MATLTACSRCRTAVPPGQQNCLRCGHAVVAPTRTCPSCEQRNEQTARFCANCGHQLDAPVVASDRPEVAATGTVDTTGVFIEYRSYRLPLLISLVVFGMLVAMLSAVNFVERYFFSPQHAATSFFDALAHRDATAARGLLSLTGGDYSPVLLQPAVLKSDGYTPPTAVRVEKIETQSSDKNQAIARVSFSLGGQRHTLSMALRRDDQTTAGLFHRWRITGGIYPMNISASGLDSVVVAGATVRFSAGNSSAVLAALPGGYAVTLPNQPLWEAPKTVAYAGVSDTEGGASAAEVVPTIKSGARDEIDRQVQSYLTECAKSTALAPPNCPFSSYGSYDQVRNIRWKIVKSPQYTVEQDSYSGQVVVRTVQTGEAEVTGSGTYSFSTGTYPFDYTDTFSVSGAVVVSGDTLAFQPQS